MDPNMADPYQFFLTSMSAAGLQQTSLQGLQPPLPPVPQQSVETPMLGEFITQPPAQLQEASSDGTKTPSGRRKSSVLANPAIDAVKHRRTRSGCFTCRSRRVKCDEKRPICERCQKGNRDCVYPDPPSKKPTMSRAARSKEQAAKSGKPSPLSSTGEYEDGRSPPVYQGSSSDRQKESSVDHITTTPKSIDHESQTSPDDNRSSPSSSTGVSTIFATAPYDPADFPTSAEGKPDFSHLQPDYQDHMAWYGENITYFHYGLPYDMEGFFDIILPQIALHHEALLNAVVAFAAYQRTVANVDGKVEDFLVYYNRAVSLLLDSLRKKEKHGVATLLTILQIAQIEEYLGDWVNVMGHEKAAHEIYTGLFAPETAMETPVGRVCLHWYARFDGFISFRASFPSGLPPEYIDNMAAYYKSQLELRPDDITMLAADRTTSLRKIAMSQAFLFARRNRGQISQEEFVKEHHRHTQMLRHYRENWHPLLTDPQYLVTDFGGRTPDPEDIVNPYQSGLLYRPPLFVTTVASAEWHSLMVMHLIHLLPLDPASVYPEIMKHVFAVCNYFSAAQKWPETPKGFMLQLTAVVQVSGPFLPKDEKHNMWTRRQSAYSEQIGIIRPKADREKLAQILNEPSCERWWLPNDEGFTPVLKRLREFADERNAIAVTAQQESVREVRQLYEEVAKLSLDDS